MDGLIMRLECLNRSLANLDSPDTDEIMLLIGEAISCMSRDRSLSLEFDGVNFPLRVSTQRRGRPSFEIKQEQLAFLSTFITQWNLLISLENHLFIKAYMHIRYLIANNYFDLHIPN